MTGRDSPPPIDGLAPSRVWLSAEFGATVLDGLCTRFPSISRQRWTDRFARGRVLDASSNALTATHSLDTPLTVYYYREVPDEAPIPFHETIVFVDDHLVIADKPHFLPVMPRGGYVHETLAARLVRRLNNPHLVPLHRLDRDTAGLVMFSAHPGSRDRYLTLFRQRAITKRYQALAPPLPQMSVPRTHRSRLVTGEPFFRMRETDGPANSETHIDVIETGDRYWRYALRPVTGRKHQLRVHMAALGAPIVNDPLYPELRPVAADCYQQPLKLLAQALEFIDPVTGEPRLFETGLNL